MAEAELGSPKLQYFLSKLHIRRLEIDTAVFTSLFSLRLPDGCAHHELEFTGTSAH